MEAWLRESSRSAGSSPGRGGDALAAFIGASPAAMAVKRQARCMADADGPVLLVGEPGTGKTLLAQAIHAASHRARRPLVELGGAVRSMSSSAWLCLGLLRRISGGTLLVREVGDLSLPQQARLWSVLQAQEGSLLDGNRVRQPDVRLIATSCQDLQAQVAQGRFMPELLDHLQAMSLVLPPLRERLADLDALSDHLLDDIRRRAGRSPCGLSCDGLALLARHRWPGNLTELRQVLQQVGELTDASCLRAADLAVLMRPRMVKLPERADEPCAAVARIKPLHQVVAEMEASAIRAALVATRGNKLAAARALGIARATLYEKMTALGMSLGRHAEPSPEESQGLL